MSATDVFPIYDVIPAVELVACERQPIILTRTYKGITLHQDIRVLAVQADRVVCQATDLRKCAGLKGTILLHGQRFIRPVMARLTDFNLVTGTFHLDNLAYVDSDWKERSHERVQPKNPTYLNVRCHHKIFRAYLENISLIGVGLLAEKRLDEEMHVRPCTNVLLDFQLEPRLAWSTLKGRVVSKKSIGNQLTRLGIQIYPTLRDSKLLWEYIARREDEILRELNQAYLEAFKAPGPERMYF